MRQGDSDSDGLAGHVWAVVMDAGGTVISKAFQGRHDRASYMYVCMFGCGCECVSKIVSGCKCILRNCKG